MKVLYHTTGRG